MYFLANYLIGFSDIIKQYSDTYYMINKLHSLNAIKMEIIKK